MKQTMAICLSGISYLENFHHWSGIKLDINYALYVKNIKTKIYSFFEKQYDIDTFICTNSSPKMEELLDIYNPIKYSIEDDPAYHLKKKRVLFLY